MVGLLALAVALFTPKRIGRVVPSPLLAIVLGSLAALAFDVPLIGAIPSALPALQIPTVEFSLLDEMLISAAVLAALGSVDSLLTSLVADNVTRRYHDSDKELVGQGIGNLVAGLFGGIDWRFIRRMHRAPRVGLVLTLLKSQ